MNAIPCRHDADWASKPPPWNTLGPVLAAKIREFVRRIAPEVYIDPRDRRPDGTIAPKP